MNVEISNVEENCENRYKMDEMCCYKKLKKLRVIRIACDNAYKYVFLLIT